MQVKLQVRIANVLKILQSRGQGVVKSAGSTYPPALKFLSGTQMLYGTLLFLGKSAPSPAFKINMFYVFDPVTGHGVITKRQGRTIRKLDAMFGAKKEDFGDEVIDIEVLKDEIKVVTDIGTAKSLDKPTGPIKEIPEVISM